VAQSNNTHALFVDNPCLRLLTRCFLYSKRLASLPESPQVALLLGMAGLIQGYVSSRTSNRQGHRRCHERYAADRTGEGNSKVGDEASLRKKDSFSIDRAGMPSHATRPHRPSGPYALSSPTADACNADTDVAHCLGLFVRLPSFDLAASNSETPTLSNGSKCPTSGTTVSRLLHCALYLLVVQFKDLSETYGPFFRWHNHQ
jgi:hypothetical protein